MSDSTVEKIDNKNTNTENNTNAYEELLKRDDISMEIKKILTSIKYFIDPLSGKFITKPMYLPDTGKIYDETSLDIFFSENGRVNPENKLRQISNEPIHVLPIQSYIDELLRNLPFLKEFCMPVVDKSMYHINNFEKINEILTLKKYIPREINYNRTLRRRSSGRYIADSDDNSEEEVEEVEEVEVIESPRASPRRSEDSDNEDNGNKIDLEEQERKNKEEYDNYIKTYTETLNTELVKYDHFDLTLIRNTSLYNNLFKYANIDTIKYFIDNTVNLTVETKISSFLSTLNTNIIEISARFANMEIFEYIKKKYDEKNSFINISSYRESFGRTFLTLAIIYENYEIIDYFLNKTESSDILSKDNDGKNLLYYVCMKFNYEKLDGFIKTICNKIPKEQFFKFNLDSALHILNSNDKIDDIQKIEISSTLLSIIQ